MKQPHLLYALAAPLAALQLAAQPEPQVANWLRTQDKNQDGAIAKSEATGLMARFFQRNDINKDGLLDTTELNQLASRLANNNNRNQNRTRTYPDDATLRAQAPEGVTLELNIAYREGNPAWRLDLARPKDAAPHPRPAIVFIHGGGWRGGDKRAGNFIGPAMEYAAKGYVTISVNYRLDRQILPCVHDVKCAVRWLRAHATRYNIDPNRIGAYGNSAGAHLATLLALSPTIRELDGDSPWKEYSSRLQAVVASATPTLPHFGTGTDTIKHLVAPMTYVSRVATPLLLIHDADDRTVPVENADRLVTAPKTAGAQDVTYQRYTNQSGHGVFQRNAEETKPLMEAFFARTL